ncbi:MAG: transglycosylase SLT domain-containing protein, partial [Candidatus Krumholzibacteriota bacterium]|nr:transglycosylase SLT domain-containing protein [Candidatus Krumholzibacteriota bacterium]
YYRRGVYRRAADLAKPAYSEPGYKRQSMLILARSYRRIGRATDAAAIYESFARIYPNHRKSAEALFVAGRIYDRADRRSAAERVRLRLRRAYPSSYFGRMAILESAERHVDVGEYSRAADVLGRRVKRSRRTDEAAMFYLADVYRKTGNVEGSDLLLNELRALDPYSFYIHPWISPTYVRPIINSRGSVTLDGAGGLIEFLERAFAERDAAYVRIAGLLQRGDGGSSTAAGASCLERGVWFLDVGFRDWGERELSEARRVCYDSPGELLELARIYEEYAMPWRSVRLVQKVRAAIHWRLRREHADDFRWLLYPTPYPTQVLGNAARHDLPPQLVYAMIREESRFDVEAVSRVGALGLMQLMPETGRYVARELELSGWVEEDLLDPEINITFGIWYAASLAEQGNGDYLWMLAAYNAGPGNARRWFDGFDGDTIRVVDAIDFRETRNYVQRIVESANIYHSLYFGDGSSPR